TVYVAGRDKYAAGEAGLVGLETVELRVEAIRAAVDLDVRHSPRSRPGDDIEEAVAVDVGRRHMDAAKETGLVGAEAEQQGGGVAVVDMDDWPVAGIRAGDH